MKIREIFGDSRFNRRLWHLAWPIALQSLLLASVAAADALMLGLLEQNAMAAVALAAQISFVMSIFILGIASGGSVLAAQYWGKKDPESLDHIFHIMLRIMTLVDLVFFLASFFIPRQLMMIYSSDGLLIELGGRYLRIAAWSYLLMGISQCYQVFMKISDHARSALYVSSAAVLMNIAFNAVFIFGIGPIPQLRAEGAAIATVISRLAELVICLFLSCRPGYLHPRTANLLKVDSVLSRDFIRVSLPLLGASLLWGAGFSAYTAIVGHLGADAAAANSVASVVRDLICCLCNGIAAAGGILLGQELGAGNQEEARRIGIRLRDISFFIGFVSMGMVLFLTIPVVAGLKLTPLAQSYLTGMMLVQAFYMIGRTVNTVMINGIFDSGGDTIFDLYSLVVAMWGISIPVALFGAFYFHWPVLAVYACTCLDELGKIPWVCYHFQKYQWLKNLTRG